MWWITVLAVLVLNNFSEGKCEEELISIALLYRHGDRTPISTYPKDPYKDILYQNDDPGQLTNVGKMRQFKLGEWLRERYDFPKNYSHRDIYVLSGDTDRCLMSASSNLAGLYPPEDKQIWNPDLQWQPIPIHVDNRLLSGAPATCPAFDVLMAELVTSEYINNINKVNQELMEFVANNTGEIILHFLQLGLIRDILSIESTLNLTLPAWTQDVYPEKLEDLGAIGFSLPSNNTDLSRYSAGPLLYDILQNFDNSSKKIYMYSGHDTNVANVLFTLAPDLPKFCPEFATTLIFELWKKDGENVIKVLLKRNEEAVPVDVKGCGEECNLSVFKESLKNVIINPLEWEVECFGL